MSDGILKFSNAEGVTAYNRYPNFLTNYGDFGAMQRIGFLSSANSGSAYLFSNIPQTFQDLMFVVFSRDTNASVNPVLFNFINGDSSSLYSYTTLTGDGSSASSGRVSSTTSLGAFLQTGANATTGVFASNVIHILNYANTSTFKTMLGRSAADNNGSGATRLSVGLYRSTNAITSFSVTPASAFASGTTVALYGVRASAA